jgi:hypothetical protein
MDLSAIPTLTGTLVTLEPLSIDHLAELRVAADESESFCATRVRCQQLRGSVCKRSR